MISNGASAQSTRRRSFRPQDGRQQNLALITQALYDNPGLSRADLARLTGLTRVTISDLVAQLLAENLLVETGSSDEVRPGKRATKLQVDANSRSIIAIDLSREATIRGAVFALRGEVTKRLESPLGKGTTALEQLIQTLRSLLDAAEQQVLGICIGTPGTVSGNLVSASNLDWHFLNLAQVIFDEVGIQAEIHNDANLAAIAELRFGSAESDLVRVQISGGLGAGLLINGDLVEGSSGAAGEIGHVVVEHDGAQCACGKIGCLETWTAVPALARRIESAPEQREEILAEAGRRLGMALSPIIGMLNLTDVIIGGPKDLISGHFLQAAQELVAERIGIESLSPVLLRESKLGEDAVLLGAAALVLRNKLGVF